MSAATKDITAAAPEERAERVNRFRAAESAAPRPNEAPPVSTFDTKASETADKFRAALVTSSDLSRMELPSRPRILGSWLREGDLGFIFAPRGVGKSWLSMMIADAIAQGRSLGEWDAGDESRRVVYLDAEMNLPDTRERSMALGMRDVVWLHNERVFDELRRAMNIADPLDQAALERILNPGDVLFVDNLSTSAGGMEENNNDDWERVRDWLIRFRHRQITVVIVHHAGRNGQMRGASRREDMAHWIISLMDAADEGSPTAFVSTFTKSRNCRASEAPPLKWQLHDHQGHVTYTCKRQNGVDAMLSLIVDGVETAGDLAVELGVTKGCVSKWARKLEAEGSIRKEGRKYVAATVQP